MILLLLVSIFIIVLVAGITYVYSKNNHQTTLMVTGLTTLTLLMAACILALDRYLHEHFLGAFDNLGVPYVEAKPGWQLMLDAWPIWIAPVVIVLLLVNLSVGYWWKKRFTKQLNSSQIQQQQPASAKAFTSDLVALQLEIKQLKAMLHEANEKLSKAQQNKIDEDKKNQDLQILINQMQAQHDQLKQKLQQEIKSLQEAISIKEQEHDSLLVTIQQKDVEVERAKTMLKNLLDEKNNA